VYVHVCAVNIIMDHDGLYYVYKNIKQSKRINEQMNKSIQK